MSKEYIEKMLDGIDDKYIEEAVNKPGNGKQTNKKTFSKMAVAASICLLVVGISASVFAATNTTFWKRINPFSSKEVKTEHGGGVTITKEKEQDDSKKGNKEDDASKTYYLVLNYLPKGYDYKGDDTFLYYAQ